MIEIYRPVPAVCAAGLLVLSALAQAAKGVPPSTQVHTTHVYEERSGEPLTWRDVLQMTDLGGVAVSPDGSMVAFVSRRAEEACNCYRQTLNLLRLPHGQPKAVADLGQPFNARQPDGRVNGALMISAPRWSADGRHLAYVKNGERPALELFDVASGATLTLKMGADPVYGFTWAAEAGTLIYQTGVIKREVLESYRRGLREGFLYGDDFELTGSDGMPRLAEVPIRGGDGSTYGTPRAATSVLKRVTVEGVVTASKDGDERWLAANGGSFTSGMFETPGVVRDPTGHQQVIRDRPYPGARDRTLILQSSPRGAGETVACGEFCEGVLVDVFWSAPLKAFAVLRRKQDTLHFFRLDGGARKEIELFTLGVADDGFGSLAPVCDLRADKLVCVEEEVSSPPRLVAIGMDGSRHVLFDANAQLRARHFNRSERLEWANSYGATTYAHLVYPTGYRPGQRYPLVVVQYRARGFARGGTGNENPVHPYAEAGFFVLLFDHPPDPPDRGETGKTDFERAIANFRDRHPSTQNSLDIITAHLDSRGLIDTRRIAYTGLSGGSNQIDYSLSNGVDLAAVITSTCCMGPEQPFAHPILVVRGSRLANALGWGDPVADPQGYIEAQRHQAPAQHAESIRAAILANSSEDEKEGAYPMLSIMRTKHRPMELYVYADEAHIKRQPRHRAAIFRRNIDWLAFWLDGREDPDPAKAAQYRRWRSLREEAGKAQQAASAATVAN